MKTIINFILATLLFTAVSCQKSKTQPTPSPAPSNNTTSTASTTSLTTTEAQLAGKWYYEKSETVGNGSVTSTFTYNTAPALNSVEFKCVLAASSTTDTPNYKEMEKIVNGSIISNLVWKINSVGILSMNLYGADPKATIDSLTSSRLVYTQYTSLQPLNGTRYYLYK